MVDGDIYLSDGLTAKVHQVTFTKGATCSFVDFRMLIRRCAIDYSRISAGLPSFIIQEEFDRYVGFLWQNTNSKIPNLCGSIIIAFS